MQVFYSSTHKHNTKLRSSFVTEYFKMVFLEIPLSATKAGFHLEGHILSLHIMSYTNSLQVKTSFTFFALSISF